MMSPKDARKVLTKARAERLLLECPHCRKEVALALHGILSSDLHDDIRNAQADGLLRLASVEDAEEELVTGNANSRERTRQVRRVLDGVAGAGTRVEDHRVSDGTERPEMTAAEALDWLQSHYADLTFRGFFSLDGGIEHWRCDAGIMISDGPETKPVAFVGDGPTPLDAIRACALRYEALTRA